MMICDWLSPNSELMGWKSQTHLVCSVYSTDFTRSTSTEDAG